MPLFFFVFVLNFENLEEMDEVSSIFAYNMEPQENEFKYLGFFLKRNSYMEIDWLWLVKRIDKKLSN